MVDQRAILDIPLIVQVNVTQETLIVKRTEIVNVIETATGTETVIAGARTSVLVTPEMIAETTDLDTMILADLHLMNVIMNHDWIPVAPVHPHGTGTPSLITTCHQLVLQTTVAHPPTIMARVHLAKRDPSSLAFTGLMIDLWTPVVPDL